MLRMPLVACALAALAPVALAGEPEVRLAVRPMPVPKPALKYQLLPEVRELNPGNPAQWYLRCFQEQRNFFYSKEAVAERTRYLTMPLKELPADKLKTYGGAALTQVDWGARLDTPDWQMLHHVQHDGYDLTLPELEPLRLLGPALRARFRGHVAAGRFDDAIANAKTMFALARHLGDHPTEQVNRVGLDVANLALDTLEEMVQQPNAPNLYWALTDLPSPLVDLRKGAQGERLRVSAELRPLRDDVSMTDAQLEKLIRRLSGLMGFAREQNGQPPWSLRAALAARVKDADRVESARKRLIDAGCPENRVRMFPPLQVILLDEKRDYEVCRDEGMKLLGLPAWQLARARDDRKPSDGLFADLLPHPLEARHAQAQVEQRVALLRCVEALRLHAASHEGRLPEKLDEVSVPVPQDPFTGMPVAYEREGTAAHLRGELKYSVTIQK